MRKDKKKWMFGGVLLLVVLIIGSTLAYYVWVSEDNINVSVVVDGETTVTFVGGDNVTGTLIPTMTKEEGIKKDITVVASDTGSTINLYMDLTTMPNALKEVSFKWELYYNDTVLIGNGNFEDYNEVSNPTGITYASSGITTLTLFEGRSVSTSTDKYTLYLWFNGKDYTNPTAMQNQNLSFDLYATGDNAILG